MIYLNEGSNFILSSSEVGHHQSLDVFTPINMYSPYIVTFSGPPVAPGQAGPPNGQEYGWYQGQHHGYQGMLCYM